MNYICTYKCTVHTHIYKLHHYRITSVNLHVLCIYIYIYVCMYVCMCVFWCVISTNEYIYIYVNITCYHLLQTFANINACIHSTRTRTHKNVYIYIHNQSYHILHEHSQCWMDNSCRMFTVAIWNNHSPYIKNHPPRHLPWACQKGRMYQTAQWVIAP